MDSVDKLTAANLILLLQFVAPGFLIAYFRSIFVTRKEASFKDNVLLFALVSIIYGLVLAPLSLNLTEVLIQGRYGKWFLWLVLLILLPIGIGIFLGHATQSGWIRWLWNKFWLKPLSPYTTGWDWAFSQISMRDDAYIVVTLEDGVQIYGRFGGDSLAASDPERRDIFVEEIWDINNNIWVKRHEKASILIRDKFIKHIEFIEPNMEKKDVETKS